MKKIISLAFAILSFSIVFSQSVKTDSLSNSFNNSSLQFKPGVADYDALSTRFNSVGMIAAYNPKDATQGSPYLFKQWVSGYVIDTSDQKITNILYQFNINKLSQNLLLTQDNKTFFEINRNGFKSFVLTDKGKTYFFEKINIDGKERLSQLLVESKSKYKLYKTTSTKFESANYVSNGLIQSGHNYDLYEDVVAYYVYDKFGNKFKNIELNKKSFRAMFSNEAAIENYFNKRSKNLTEEEAIEIVKSLP